MAVFTGDSGNNLIIGSPGADDIDVSQGGVDTVQAGLDADVIHLGAALTRDDRIDGGDGIDTVTLDGDYDLVLGQATLTHVEILSLGAGHDYGLKTADGVVEAGTLMAIDASALGAGDTLSFDGSNEYDGAFSLTCGAGVVDFTGGKGDDLVVAPLGVVAGSHFDGGGGYDQLDLYMQSSGESFSFDATLLVDMDAIKLFDGSVISMTLADDVVGAHQLMSIDASESGQIVFDGTAETDGRYAVIGSLGSDHLFGGKGGDYLDGGERDDLIVGGAGADTVVGGAGADSLYGGAGRDLIVCGTFDIPGAADPGVRPDRIYYTALSDSTVKRPDFIEDLNSHAIIDLHQIDANETKAGDQKFVLVSAFTGHAGELTLTYVADNDVTFLQGDVDGDGAADLEIDISGDHTDFTGFVL